MHAVAHGAAGARERPATQQIAITVDHRERAGPVWPLLRGRWDAFPTARALAVGDYIVEGRITIERKTVRDLGRSLASGRLFSQTARLKRETQRPLLVVEGDGRPGGIVLRRSVRAALLSLQAMWYLPVCFTRDPSETADCLVQLGRLWLKDTRQTWAPPVRKPRRPVDAPRRILEQVPGLGARRAAALLAHFGSLRAVFNASLDELCSVPEIGPAMARRVRVAGDRP